MYPFYQALGFKIHVVENDEDIPYQMKLENKCRRAFHY